MAVGDGVWEACDKTGETGSGAFGIPTAISGHGLLVGGAGEASKVLGKTGGVGSCTSGGPTAVSGFGLLVGSTGGG
jgi:hypothetical protein